MRKLFDYVKEHMAMSAVVLGVAIMLIAGIVMIIVSSGGKDNTKHLSDIAESSVEDATDSDENTVKDDTAANEDTPSSDEPSGDASSGDEPNNPTGDASSGDNPNNPNGDASSGDNPNNPTGDASDGDSEGGNKPSGSADGTGEGGNKPGSDKPSGGSSDGGSSDGDEPSDDSSDSDSSASSDGDSNKPSDTPSGDSDKPSDTPSDDDMTEEEKFLTKNKIEYVTNSDGTVTITGGSLYGDVVIPATIEGKKTIVGERAFYSYGSVCEVTSLVIKSIEVKSNAFSDCNKLVSVTFSAEVERLGEDAFSDCDNLSSVSFLGNKVTEIPKGLFNRCTKLSSIALPSSITKVNASFVTSGNYYTSQAGISKPSDVDYANIVPELIVYISSEPSEVWTENNASGYVRYNSLLEGLMNVRKANIEVVNN